MKTYIDYYAAVHWMNMTPDKWNEKNRGNIKIDRSYVAHYMRTE